MKKKKKKFLIFEHKLNARRASTKTTNTKQEIQFLRHHALPPLFYDILKNSHSFVTQQKRKKEKKTERKHGNPLEITSQPNQLKQYPDPMTV